jgi:hypothetical protein
MRLHFFTYLSLLNVPQASANDRVNTAIRIIVTFCGAGGESKVTSQSSSSPSGGDFRFKSASGSFTVTSTEAQGLVDGLRTEISALSADQANRARDCMKSFIPQVLAMATEEYDEESNVIVPAPRPILPNQILHNSPVYYYLKTADGTQVTNTLKRRGISFTQLSSVLPDNKSLRTLVGCNNAKIALFVPQC